MPNYRQKQPKKKNNKNRNKNNKNQPNQQQQDDKSIEPDQASDSNISKKPATDCTSSTSHSKGDAEPADNTLAKLTESTVDDALNNTKCERERQPQEDEDVKAASKSLNANSVPSDDTVLHGTATHAELLPPCSSTADFMTQISVVKREETESTRTTQFLEMGGNNSKAIDDRLAAEEETESPNATSRSDQPPLQRRPKEPLENGKVIINRIVLEAAPNALGKNSHNEHHPKESTKDIAENDSANATISKLHKEMPLHETETEIQIQEVSDNSSGEYNTDNPPIVCEMESEPETNDERLDETDDQISESIYIDEASSSSYYAQQDDLKQRRVQKRAAIENHFLPQYLSPRYLDSIVEENSDMSDARSDCSDHPMATSHTEYSDDLKEEYLKAKKANAIFPKSNLDFSKRHKHGPLPKVPTMSSAIREEPQAMVVETKLIEQSHVEESCSRLASIQTPESEAPEIVYINSASSSISDLMDLDFEECADKSCSSVDLDTDFKEIITTPLSTTTTTETNTNDVTSRESTPVNQTSQTILAETEVLKCATPHSNTISTDDQHIVRNRQTEIHESVRLQDNTAQLSSVSNSLSSGNETTRQNVNELVKRGNLQSVDTTSSASTEFLTSSDSYSLSAKHHAVVNSIVRTEKTEMESVREIINGKNANAVSDTKNNLFDSRCEPLSFVAISGNNNVTDDLPPPIPPPPPATYLTSEHFPTASTITNNGTFALGSSLRSSEVTEPELPNLNLSTKPNTNTAFVRQESADSHCSDSTCYSQCTAINTAQSPLRDFDVMSPISDYENSKTPNDQQHHQYQYQDAEEDSSEKPIKKLRLLCAETLSSMPYGEEVLEELANVSQNIGEVRAANSAQSGHKMPYPLPPLPHISDLQLSISGSDLAKSTHSNVQKLRSPTPPPVPEPPAKYNNDTWLGLPSDANPKLLVCLSPSQQQSYISDKKLTSDHKADQLLDAHQKFIERRGYHEYSLDQVKAMEGGQPEEEQILKTAAIMKKLRKSLSPPPIPPPPVPSKSSETAAKAQNKIKTITTAATTTTTTTARTKTTTNTDNDASSRNANDEAADGEENRHRLLAIIHNTNETRQSQTAKASSFENSSRQSTNKQGEPLQNTERPQEAHTAPAHSQAQPQSHSQPITVRQKPEIQKSPQETASSSISEKSVGQQDSNTQSVLADNSNNMQSVESELANMFPSMGQTNIFDADHKRFSNIESFSNGDFCSQLLSTQPKRFSNIETRSFESKKEIRDGEVVYDVTNFKRDSHTDGDETLRKEALQFPFQSQIPELQRPSTSGGDGDGVDGGGNNNIFCAAKKDANDEQQKTKNSPNAEEIMSALKLNTENFKTSTTTTTNSSQQHKEDYKLSTVEPLERRADIINRQQSENTALTKGITSTYEEFRQRAKTAAEAASSSSSAAPSTAAPTSAPTSATISANQPFKSSNHFDQANLFKDFDELSKQLHMELESGKAQREQREKSASLYDLSRTQIQFKHQFEDLKKQRHEHMQELEREIERSIRSRKSRSVAPQDPTSQAQVQCEQNPVAPRTFEIPIQLEGGFSIKAPAAQKPENARIGTYNIPIQIEPRYEVTSPMTPHNLEHEDPSRYRRAESMFNISDNASQQSDRQRTTSINYGEQNHDDWSRYASDLGSSENIARPFAREVKICYQRQRPQGIRAPRPTASTNDLSLNSHGFDSYNAYNVRRTHAPMLSNAPQQRTRPQYLSCTSMIERNPNPTYISTTSRRGVSPAPPPPLQSEPPRTPIMYRQHDQEHRQRRASLPREIHEQQLKYIISKEDELKTEFERLQNERRRLMEEMNRPQIIPTPPQRPMREVYRPAPKLPTLSEDEVFRQQMAEEWLNKVAEREERRLQKIIKISKINEHEGLEHEIHHTGASQPDISEEFLHRVKERRSKLAMPSDSDWESGAESHPLARGHASETEEPPTIKIIEGKAEADLKQLPRHLREFAKFSNHQNEQIDGGNREVHQEEERRQEVTDNCISSASKKSSVVKTVKISRHPEETSGSTKITDSTKSATQGHGQGQVFADLEPLSTTTPTMPYNTCTIPQSPFFTKLPASFDEMFATSPFRNRIYEEFDNYWRSFDNTT